MADVHDAPRLLSRGECLALATETKHFYRASCTVLGGMYDVEFYNYCSSTRASHFGKYGAWELRGLAFVKPAVADGEAAWEAYRLQEKFFNYGECGGWLREDVEGKRVVRVQDKADGSIISFLPFKHCSPHATSNALVTRPGEGSAVETYEILARSKMSFDSEQARDAQRLLNTDGPLRELVAHCLLDLNAVPMFELIGPANPIIVPYSTFHFVLLQVRDNATGAYWDAAAVHELYGKFFDPAGVPDPVTFEDVVCGEAQLYSKRGGRQPPVVVPAVEYSGVEWMDLDRLATLQCTSTRPDIEGFVVTFDDGMKMKMKMGQYCNVSKMTGLSKHGVRECTGKDFNTGRIVAAVLGGTVDDLAGALAALEHNFAKQLAAFVAQEEYVDDPESHDRTATGLREIVAYCHARKAEMDLVASTLDDYIDDEAERLVGFALNNRDVGMKEFVGLVKAAFASGHFASAMRVAKAARDPSLRRADGGAMAVELQKAARKGVVEDLLSMKAAQDKDKKTSAETPTEAWVAGFLRRLAALEERYSAAA